MKGGSSVYSKATGNYIYILNLYGMPCDSICIAQANKMDFH